jgi:hypothetical protein
MLNLKVLKLRSGEEIACQVLEENDTFLKIHKPMIFKTIVSHDEAGRIIDITSLHDWLVNTDSKEIDLPINHIAFRTDPNQSTIKLYEIESYREFESEEKDMKVSADLDALNNNSNSFNMDTFGMFLEDLMNTTEEALNKAASDFTPKMNKNKKRRKKQKSQDYLPPDMIDESELDRHMIMMQLYVPAEAIMNLVTSGTLDPKILLNMINEVKKRNRFTGDEKDHKNFGNRYSDWNPDPKSDDYG